MRFAFHSHKGGVGRTKIMIGVGALMAHLGHRVGMVDYDIYAPSLTTLLEPEEREFKNGELLRILAPDVFMPQRVVPALRTVDDLVEEHFKAKLDKNATLRYLPTFPDTLEVTLADKHGEHELESRLDKIAKTFLAEGGVDYLLMDLTPGRSPTARAMLPHSKRVVVVARIDNQNIEGLRHATEEMKIHNPIVVANMVPESPNTARRLEELQDIFKKVASLDHVRIVYDPEATFDDNIRLAGDPETPIGEGVREVYKYLIPRNKQRKRDGSEASKPLTEE